MTSVLRIYDPEECDPAGVPLDWGRCRGLDELDGGMGSLHEACRQRGEQCPYCIGHGSLKAAALAKLARKLTDKVPAAALKAGDVIAVWVQHFGEYETRHVVAIEGHEITLGDGDRSYVWAAGEGTTALKRRWPTVRCEDCGHPMSEGTWEGRLCSDDPVADLDTALLILRRGQETDVGCVHYSPCDEGCRHGGPSRAMTTEGWRPFKPTHAGASVTAMTTDYAGSVVEASWRPVDVRTLGWRCDLRPAKLAVLCLRCWAAR